MHAIVKVYLFVVLNTFVIVTLSRELIQHIVEFKIVFIYIF